MKHDAAHHQTAFTLLLNLNRSTPITAPAIQLPTTAVIPVPSPRPPRSFALCQNADAPPPSLSIPTPTTIATIKIMGATNFAIFSIAEIPIMADMVKISPHAIHAINTSSVIGGTASYPKLEGLKTIIPLGFPIRPPHISATIPTMLENHPNVSSAIIAIGKIMPLLPYEYLEIRERLSPVFCAAIPKNDVITNRTPIPIATAPTASAGLSPGLPP